jgi:hypothetical protein
MFRAGLYARVSTNDQQTIPLQMRALREYAGKRVWTIALQVKEVGSGASQRQLREKLLDAARREIDVVLVWRLDRWGRSVTDLLATLQELEHLGVGFVSLNEALDLTTPAGRAMAALLAVFAAFEREILQERVRGRSGPRPAERQALGPAGNCSPTCCGNPETTSRWRQQIRDRPSVADRTHVGPPNPGSKVMKKSKKDPVREERIHNEAIADAHGPEEQVMGWYYYLDDKIRFPFQAMHRSQSCRSGKGKPSKSSAWHLKTPAPPTCSC